MCININLSLASSPGLIFRVHNETDESEKNRSGDEANLAHAQIVHVPIESSVYIANSYCTARVHKAALIIATLISDTSETCKCSESPT